MSIVYRILIVFLLWLGTSHADGPSYILIVGDSLSAAHGLDPSQGWPILLAERIQAKGLPYQVINISMSGETTHGGLEKLPAALKEYQPSIVILALGANDGLRGLSLIAMKQNLNKMVEISQDNDATVLLIGMRLPANYGPAYQQAFEKVFEEVVEEHNLTTVPFLLEDVALDPKYVQEDNLHPNAAAQPLILENIWPTLEPMLKSK